MDEEALKGGTTLAPDSPVDILLEKEIRNLEQLHSLQRTAKFVALDCEFVSDIDWEGGFSQEEINASHAPTEVGLACLDELNMDDSQVSGKTGELRLKHFFKDFHVQAHCIKINGRYHDRVEHIKQNPRSGKYGKKKTREDFWFGTDEYIDSKHVECRLRDIIREYRHSGAKDLMLVGYEIRADFVAMRRDFPAVASLFGGWLDIRSIIRAMFGKEAQSFEPPGVRSLLKLFGYHQKDYDPNGAHGTYHNAGNDAVRTLALLRGLMVEENIENLRFKQRVPKDVDFFEGKLYPHGREGVVLLRPTDRSSLPDELGTVLKIAFFAAPYDPQAVGMNEQVYSAGQTKEKLMVTRGWVMFKCEENMEAFIHAANGTKWGEKTLLAVRPQGARSFAADERPASPSSEMNTTDIMSVPYGDADLGTLFDGI